MKTPKVIRSESQISYNYATIKITQSRLNKGLLAIPVSLLDYFPKRKTKIYVATEKNEGVIAKNFTPYTSSSRECRIGGMRDFYRKFQIKEGDELVIQVLDDNKYRILPERRFENIVKMSEDEFDKSHNEDEAILKLQEVSEITGSTLKETAFSEYHRLLTTEIRKRKIEKARLTSRKESVPASIKKLLMEIYQGKCQITDFTFIMQNGKPYFEIHHIKSEMGNHLKNLLVVCPNTHAQFTYASVEEFFDREGWLRRVNFNKEKFFVNQIIDKMPKRFEKEVHFDL